MLNKALEIAKDSYTYISHVGKLFFCISSFNLSSSYRDSGRLLSIVKQKARNRSPSSGEQTPAAQLSKL